MTSISATSVALSNLSQPPVDQSASQSAQKALEGMLTGPDNDTGTHSPYNDTDESTSPGGCIGNFGDREPFITEDGKLAWRTVVSGTSGDDTITVVFNEDGTADVTINGETTHYSADEARNMRIDGGAGDDTITIEDNRVTSPLGRDSSVTVEGGSGDDTITVEDNRRNIFGLPGGGSDIRVDGGSGDDHISGDLHRVDVDGGTGDNTIEPNFMTGPFPIPGPPVFPTPIGPDRHEVEATPIPYETESTAELAG